MGMSNETPNELIQLATQACPEQGMFRTSVPQLQIARSNRITEPTQTVYTPALCFIIQGEKDAVVAGKFYHYNTNEYLVTSVALPVTGQVTMASEEKPYLCLILDLEAALIYELLKAAAENEVPKATRAKGQGIHLEKVNPHLSDAFLRLLRCLDKRTERAVLAPMIVREICYRLLTSNHGDIIQQIGVKGSQTQRVAKVIERIRKDFAKAFAVDDLAKIAGMSASSFHQHFKDVTGMSPLQYQKSIRLQEARKLLIAELTDASTAAYQVGYESASQFNREYSRAFGLPPISDVKRVRDSGNFNFGT
jgi:AraC-like DNA-binding protein